MQKIALIVPTYNEQKRLDLPAFAGMLGNHQELDFFFVDDASLDGTAGILEQFCANYPGRANLTRHKINLGKAGAVRSGVLRAAASGGYTWIGFWDADLSVPVSQFALFAAAISASPDILMVFGSRVKRLGARIERTPLRHIFGRAFATAVGVMIESSVYDSQCGAKFFRAGLASYIFSEKFLSRWLFDVELILRAIRKTGRKDFIKKSLELPLTEWRDVNGSKLGLYDMLAAPIELIWIKIAYRDCYRRNL
jgi:glycosyltransferase involved in cell wall biosynthesis